jgi:hypothetical protein
MQTKSNNCDTFGDTTLKLKFFSPFFLFISTFLYLPFKKRLHQKKFGERFHISSLEGEGGGGVEDFV